MNYLFIMRGNSTQISHSEMLTDHSMLVYIRKDMFNCAKLTQFKKVITKNP